MAGVDRLKTDANDLANTMAQPERLRHIGFRVVPAASVVQPRIVAVLSGALLLGIGLGAASITPQSGWLAAVPSGGPVTHDAARVRPVWARG